MEHAVLSVLLASSSLACASAQVSELSGQTRGLITSRTDRP